jgi:serine/threonine-protein kinase/endoribonuclease IRE1
VPFKFNLRRYLKPQNVLITPQRRGKLADMGLAKRLNLTEGTSFETHLAGLCKLNPV